MLAGLLDDGEGRVDREVDPADRLGRVAGDQADLVPRLGGRAAGRGRRAPGRRRRGWCARGPGRARTDDIHGVNVALYQLSYRPRVVTAGADAHDRTCGVIVSGRAGSGIAAIALEPDCSEVWTVESYLALSEFHAGASSQSRVERVQDSPIVPPHPGGHPARGRTPRVDPRREAHDSQDHGASLRATAVVPAVALVAAGFAAAGTTASVVGSTSPASVSRQHPRRRVLHQHRRTHAPRRRSTRTSSSARPGKPVSRQAAAERPRRRPRPTTRKHAKGNPVAARQLAKVEAKAIRTGRAPRRSRASTRSAKTTQQAKLLTILVEFNAAGQRRLHRRRWCPTASAPRAACRATSRTAPRTTSIPNPAHVRPQGQQLDVGPGLLVRALQQDALHQDGHHPARPPRPQGPRRQGRASTSPATP